MLKASTAFRAVQSASGHLAIMVILAGCGGVTVAVGSPDTSTADRPAAYARATQGPDGLYYGTHFRYAMPAGWQNGPKPPSANAEVWMKQQPVNRTEPIIIVSAFDSPDHVPVEAYANVSFHKDLKGSSRAIGGITATTVDGHSAQGYEYSYKNAIYHTIIVFRGGVAYIIQFGAVPSQLAAANKGPFHAFLASWHWN